MFDIEAAARDLSVALGGYPNTADTAAEPVPFAAAVRHVRQRLDALDAATAEANDLYPPTRPMPKRLTSAGSTRPSADQIK